MSTNDQFNRLELMGESVALLAMIISIVKRLDTSFPEINLSSNLTHDLEMVREAFSVIDPDNREGFTFEEKQAVLFGFDRIHANYLRKIQIN